MNKMKYKTFTWPENPSEFAISCLREPIYETLSDKSVVFRGLGPVKRTFTGKGVFFGANAYNTFKSLAALISQSTTGQLEHPVWGNFSAYLMELNLEQEPKENYVAYNFMFREADSNGAIPQ